MLFIKLFMRFTFLKKSDFIIINTFVKILNIVWMKTRLWYILFSFWKKSVFTFVNIKPKTELSSITSIIKDFASHEEEKMFKLQLRGLLWILNSYPNRFPIKVLFVILWSHTWQLPSSRSSEPPAFLIFWTLSLDSC